MEYSEIHSQIKEIIQLTHLPGRHAARSSLSHLEKAYDLINIDPEMGAFRAITAAEEASTAIIHALKFKKYKDASHLKYKKHAHKIGLLPLLTIVSRALLPFEEFPMLIINKNVKPPRLSIGFKIQINGKIVMAQPDPPLNFQITIDGKTYDFEKEIKTLNIEKKVKEIVEYVERLANLRNRLLYATPNGVPKIDGDIRPFIDQKKEEVFGILILFILIDQHPPQQFVQHCLNVYLKAILRFPHEEVFG